MSASMTPLSRKEQHPDPNGQEVLVFLTLEHRRLLELVGTLNLAQAGNGASSMGNSLGHIRSELLKHFSVKDRILIPAIKGISCPSAWGILEETVRRHRQITVGLDLLMSPSIQERQRLERLAALNHLLAESFSDEERRLFDEARRHLSHAELGELARRMSESGEQPL